MSRAALVAALVAAAVIASAVPVGAQNNDVSIGSYLVFRIRCPAGGYTVDQRIDAVQARLNDLTEFGLSLDVNSIQAVTANGESAVYAGDVLIITADRCDALANGTTPERLAQHWAERLRSVYPLGAPEEPVLGTTRSSG